MTDVMSLVLALLLPLAVTYLGGTYLEKAGIRPMALEGMMILGAAAGCLTLNRAEGQTAWTLAAAMAAAAGAGMIWALPTLRRRADGWAAGAALNLLAPAAAVIALRILRGADGALTVPEWARAPMGKAGEGLGAFLARTPYASAIACAALLTLTPVLLRRTVWGARLRVAARDNRALPDSAFSGLRLRAALLCGAYAGIGGLSFLLALGTQGPNLVAGWGLIAASGAVIARRRPGVAAALICGIALLYAALTAGGALAGIEGGEYLAQTAPYAAAAAALWLGAKGTTEEEAWKQY